MLEDVKNSVKSLICQNLALRTTSFSVSYIIKGSFYRGSIAFCNRLRGRKVVDLGKRLAFCRIIVFYVPKDRPRSPEEIDGLNLQSLAWEFDNFLEAWRFGVFWGSEGTLEKGSWGSKSIGY